MIVLQGVLTLLIVGGIAFYLTCAIVTYRFFAPSPPSPSSPLSPSSSPSPSSPPSSPPSLSPVSIFVPVCGLDTGAWENWTSLCKQNYPTYEVLFGVVDPHDAAVPTLKELVSQYPDKVKLFTGLEPRGINHKDSSLSYLLEEAKYDLFIFVDSDIRVHPDYIRTVTQPLLTHENVGMVTCAYIGYQPQSLGAAIASFGRCFDFIPSLLIAQAVDGGLKCAVGTTIATRRDAFNTFGGLQLNRIGSDYNMGKRAAAAGYIVELSHYILESDTGHETIADVFQRELRWARTIRFNRGAQYYAMIFCYGIVFCLPLMVISGFALWTIALTGITIVIRYLQVGITLRSMNALDLQRWLWALPIRDGLSFIIWLMGSYGQKVFWRGRSLRIYSDGLISLWE